MHDAAGDRACSRVAGAPAKVGGYATVYRVRRAGRDLALKVDGGANGHDERALRREYRVLQVVGGRPGFTRAYGCKRAWSPADPALHGKACLTMDYVDGPTLASQIAAGRALGEQAALAYARQGLEALSALHELGLAHRDPHPGNVIVSDQGLVLVDLALACPAQAPFQGGTVVNGYDPPFAESVCAADLYTFLLGLAHACYGLDFWKGCMPQKGRLPRTALGTWFARGLQDACKAGAPTARQLADCLPATPGVRGCMRAVWEDSGARWVAGHRSALLQA